MIYIVCFLVCSVMRRSGKTAVMTNRQDSLDRKCVIAQVEMHSCVVLPSSSLESHSNIQVICELHITYLMVLLMGKQEMIDTFCEWPTVTQNNARNTMRDPRLEDIGGVNRSHYRGEGVVMQQSRKSKKGEKREEK